MNNFGPKRGLQNLKAKAAEKNGFKGTPGDAHVDVNDDEGCGGLHSLCDIAWYAYLFDLRRKKGNVNVKTPPAP